MSKHKDNMKEFAPTRREVLGNSPNKPETIKSIETLQRIGIFTPMRDIDLYHGRSGRGEEWQVQEVNNAGNLTGYHNINKIPALNTGNRNVASDFARARTNKAVKSGERARAEVYKIVSADPDASIVSRDFDWNKLSDFEYNDAVQAIRKSLPSVFEGSPLSFEDRHKMDGLEMNDFLVNGKYGGFIGKEMINEYARQYHLSPELTNQVCGSINAKLFLTRHPEMLSRIVRAFTEDTGETEFRGISFPINREYVASWLKKMHVVGVEMRVLSATLGGRAIDNYLLFDFERVNTEAEVEKRIRGRNKRFGKLTMAAAFSNNGGANNCGESGSEKIPDIKEALNNPYATPKQIVDAAKRVPGFRNLLEADAGNWEKYSLAEHTETVLENFEYNYADKMPVGLLPLMKTGLLVHDIGKSEAARRGDKKNQEQYNVFYAERFMQAINMGDRDREFVLRMIGPGKTMVEKYLLEGRRNEDLNAIKKFCANTFQKYTGKRASDWDAHGVYSMILALQTCDSAAYTTMALTRSKERAGVVYRNAGTFNKSFKAGGLTKRGVSFK